MPCQKSEQIKVKNWDEVTGSLKTLYLLSMNITVGVINPLILTVSRGGGWVGVAAVLCVV